MPTLTVAPGLYVWELEFEGGAIRHALGSSLDAVINESTPIVRAERGPAFDGATPVLTSLVPATGRIADPAFTLRVLGGPFQPGAVVLWEGTAQPTTYVSPGEVTAAIGLLAGPPRSAPVVVETIAGLRSNALPFPITATE